MERSPLAPIFLFTARFATSSSASGVNSSFTSSSSNSFLYCLVRAFFGSERILTIASFVSCSKDTITGTRPINSGIRPNLVRSLGSTFRKSSSISISLRFTTSALNPIEPALIRCSTIFSRPSKAPPQIKRILVVSIWISS